MSENEVIVDGISQDAKNIAVLVWVGTIFFSFIPSLIVYLIRNEQTYDKSQAKEALNWAITVLIASFVGAILAVVLIGFLVLTAIWVLNIVFCIMGAVAASQGNNFKTPFAIRLLK